MGVSGLPVPPAWLGGVVVVLFAFLLGRCTAGGGDDETTATTTTTIPAVVITTLAIQTTHTVQENETLAAIASRYGVTIDAIAAANPEVTDINNIFKGQVLKIPFPPSATTLPPATTTTTKKKGK
jgi:LysM repeat protein